MTLPEYIGSRREFDGESVQHVWAALLERGKIDDTATLKDIFEACQKAARLVDMLLR